MNKRLIPISMIATSVILWLIFFKQLPDKVPMQWGTDGSVNWYGSKGVAFFVNNGFLIFSYLILALSPKIDPKKKNYQQFSRSYRIILHTTTGLFFVINLFVLFTSLGYQLNLHFFVPVLVGLLLIVMGNYMQTIKPNWFIGIKTPWTLNNEDIWRKTHRLGSKIFILFGFSIIFTIFIPEAIIFPVILISGLITILFPIGYSYYLYRRMND